jgi:hypothetical protein
MAGAEDMSESSPEDVLSEAILHFDLHTPLTSAEIVRELEERAKSKDKATANIAKVFLRRYGMQSFIEKWDITPYRTAAERPMEVQTKQFGLIRTPKRLKPHRCRPPSFLTRILYFLIGRRIPGESLWRCSDCGEVYCLSEQPMSIDDRWVRSSIHVWKGYGGDE